jgi:TRAP transporter 4TM/12TM fusion protein
MTAGARDSDRWRAAFGWAYLAVAVFFFAYLFNYYRTTEGGPILLAFTLIPVTYILFTLNALRGEGLYPRLPGWANRAIGAVYIAASAAVAVYMTTEYEEIGTVRAGFFNTTDLVMGSVMTLLILEYARLRYMALFVLNVILILYAVYGWVVPGMFYHPGLSWTRIVSAMGVEMTTGIFSNLSQLALTVIGAFLLVLSALRAYGCIDSILRATKQIAVRSPHALPQSAVLGSMGVGAVSGSGAANAITIGTATIPAMIGAGMPPASAAAIESASSLGGQLMPPVMGIAAFLMAEFLGRSYFDVVARGYAPALVFYCTVAVSVYLLSSRYRTRLVVLKTDAMGWRDWVNIGAFVAVIAGLIGLMAVLYLAPMFAALYVFVVVGAFLVVAHIVPMAVAGRLSAREIVRPLGRFVDIFADMTSDLALLLATLSIMTGALVITGVPTKLGALLIEAAGVNLAAMAVLAFVFGAILGTGLPPAPTYIITAIVIAPPMIRMGVDPWVVHFFAFFLGVWGELTPPTSIVAAITAKIAGAPFMQVMWRALLICVSLFTLMAGVFIRPALVVEPGLAQIGAALLILAATIGITFAIQARFAERRTPDIAARIVLGAFALTALLHPSDQAAALACVPVLLFVGYWILRRRSAAPAEVLDAARS